MNLPGRPDGSSPGATHEGTHESPLGARPRIARVTRRASGICAAAVLTQAIPALMMIAPIRPGAAAMEVLQICHESLILSFGLALALELRELAVLRRHALGRRIVVAGGAALAIAVSGLLAFTDLPIELGIAASASALRLHLWWFNSLVAAVALCFLSQRHGSHEAEQRNILAMQRLAQSRRRLAGLGWQAGEAWLEPQMVFESLSRAREAYAVDLAKGDAALNRLASFLRLNFDGASRGDPTPGRDTEHAAAPAPVSKREAS